MFVPCRFRQANSTISLGLCSLSMVSIATTRSRRWRMGFFIRKPRVLSCDWVRFLIKIQPILENLGMFFVFLILRLVWLFWLGGFVQFHSNWTIFKYLLKTFFEISLRFLWFWPRSTVTAIRVSRRKLNKTKHVAGDLLEQIHWPDFAGNCSTSTYSTNYSIWTYFEFEKGAL